MRVVSNTSPISNLAIIGRLDLLPQRYGRVWIPPAVADELDRLTHGTARARIEAAFTSGWLLVETPAEKPPPLPFPLDAGEREAIALAVSADVLLLDEKRGRTAARQVGRRVAGVLGELLHSKWGGRLPALQPEIRRLRNEAGFFIDAEIERFMLLQAGE